MASPRRFPERIQKCISAYMCAEHGEHTRTGRTRIYMTSQSRKILLDEVACIHVWSYPFPGTGPAPGQSNPWRVIGSLFRQKPAHASRTLDVLRDPTGIGLGKARGGGCHTCPRSDRDSPSPSVSRARRRSSRLLSKTSTACRTSEQRSSRLPRVKCASAV